MTVFFLLLTTTQPHPRVKCPRGFSACKPHPNSLLNQLPSYKSSSVRTLATHDIVYLVNYRQLSVQVHNYCGRSGSYYDPPKNVKKSIPKETTAML